MEGLDRRLFDVVYEIAAADNRDELRRVVTEGVSVAVPCDLASYTEVWFDPPEVFALLDHSVPDGAVIESELGRLAHQHPLITRTTAEAETISDYLTARAFHELDLYRDVYRRLGAEDQLAITVESTRRVVIGVALNRSCRSFDEADRERLNALRPQIVRGYRRTLARERARGLLEQLQRGEPESATGLIALSLDGSVAMISDQARRWLNSYFPDDRGDRLAPGLTDWVEVQPDGEAATLTVAGEGSCLQLTLLPSSPGEPRLVELRERTDDRRLAVLTQREREILQRVGQGDSNQAIADQLGLSPRTIEGHLRSIFRKLGVSNRTAAAAWLAKRSGRREA